MPTEKTLALVIRAVDFSETSRVVTLFTREFGKLGALAKGAKRLRGPFAGALDLLSVCRIVLIRKHSESLDLLTEAELVKGFAPQRNSLQVLNAGYYFAELLLELTDEYDPHPALFDVAVELLEELESAERVRLIIRRFELAVLRETGHMPELSACVTCEQSVVGTHAVAFSAAAGGVLCEACAQTGRGAIRVHAGSLRILELLSSPASSQWRRLQMQPGLDREVAAVTRAAILHLVGRELRTAPFLGDSPT